MALFEIGPRCEQPYDRVPSKPVERPELREGLSPNESRLDVDLETAQGFLGRAYFELSG